MNLVLKYFIAIDFCFIINVLRVIFTANIQTLLQNRNVILLGH